MILFIIMVLENEPSFSQSKSIEKETVEKPVKKKTKFIDNQSIKKEPESNDKKSSSFDFEVIFIIIFI